MAGKLINTIKELPGVRLLRLFAITAEARWFDWRHNVETQADRSEQARDWAAGYPYLPIRPRVARQLLRSLPIADYSGYTFVDLGSGKGRMLLLASGFPFRRVVGVEMREDLHVRAMENVRRFRDPKARNPARSSQIETELVDATLYDFPAGNLVIYLFNPFGAQVVEKVFNRLDASFEQQPREICIVYVYPESAFLLKKMRHFQISQERTGYCMAKSRFSASLTPATPVPAEHTLRN